MIQWYKPSQEEWERILSLPYYWSGNLQIHWEGKFRYEMHWDDYTVTRWEVEE